MNKLTKIKMNAQKCYNFRRGPRSFKQDRKHFIFTSPSSHNYFLRSKTKNKKPSKRFYFTSLSYYGRAQSLRLDSPIVPEVVSNGIQISNQNQTNIAKPSYTTPSDSNINDFNWNFKNILQRPTVITKGTLDSQVTKDKELFKLDLPDAFFKVNATQNIKDTFSVIRGGLFVEVTIQGSPFSSGLLNLHCQYGNSISTATDSEKKLSSLIRDHVIGDVSDSSCTMRLRIPFRHYANYVNVEDITLGTVFLTALTNIFSKQTLQYSVTMWWDTDVDVKIIRGRTQGNSFVITKINKFGNIANSTLPMNVEGDSLEGKSKNDLEIQPGLMDLPSNTISPINFTMKNVGYLSNCENIVTLDKLTLHPAEVNTANANTFGTHEDECSYDVILGRSNLRAEYKYSTTSSAVTELFQVGPSYPHEPSTTTKPNILYSTTLDMLASNYTFWRADFTFTIHVASSRFHTGKLFFGFAPQQLTPTDLQQALGGYGVIVDIGGAKNQTSIDIPFISKFNKLRVCKGSMADINVYISKIASGISDYNFTIGSFYVVPITPLVLGASDIATEISILITESVKNVEFYRHTPASLRPRYDFFARAVEKDANTTTVEKEANTDDGSRFASPTIVKSTRKESTEDSVGDEQKLLTPTQLRNKLLGKAQSRLLPSTSDKSDDTDIPSRSIRDLFKTYIPFVQLGVSDLHTLQTSTGEHKPYSHVFAFSADYFLASDCSLKKFDQSITFIEAGQLDTVEGYQYAYAGLRGSFRYKFIISSNIIAGTLDADKFDMYTAVAPASAPIIRVSYVTTDYSCGAEVLSLHGYVRRNLDAILSNFNYNPTLFLPATINFINGNTASVEFEVPYSKLYNYQETVVKDGVQLPTNYIVMEIIYGSVPSGYKTTADIDTGVLVNSTIIGYKAFGDETRLGIYENYLPAEIPRYKYLAYQTIDQA
jgi:hypothetical protein